MKQLPLELEPTTETPALRDLTRWERMLADYRHTSMSIETHPLSLLRAHLPAGTLSSEELHAERHGRQVAFAGMTVARQRPSTAKGVVFMLLEDEHGQVNLIVPSRDLRAASRNGARRAAHPRARPLRAGGREPQRPRLVTRVAGPARTKRGGRRHGVAVAPAPALFRPPLARDRAQSLPEVWQPLGRDRDQVRAQRRCRHRVPRRRGGACRPRLRAGLLHASRDQLGAAAVPKVLRAPCGVHTTCSVRQAGHGHVGPRRGRHDARGAHGRHSRDHGRDRQ